MSNKKVFLILGAGFDRNRLYRALRYTASMKIGKRNIQESQLQKEQEQARSQAIQKEKEAEIAKKMICSKTRACNSG